jgi:NADH dehydrogenase
MAQIGAFLTAPLPHGLRPLTVDQVRMLMRPNVVDEAAIKEGRTLQGLGIANPHAMAGIVPEYLERFRPHGQFAGYRS